MYKPQIFSNMKTLTGSYFQYVGARQEINFLRRENSSLAAKVSHLNCHLLGSINSIPFASSLSDHTSSSSKTIALDSARRRRGTTTNLLRMKDAPTTNDPSILRTSNNPGLIRAGKQSPSTRIREGCRLEADEGLGSRQDLNELEEVEEEEECFDLLGGLEEEENYPRLIPRKPKNWKSRADVSQAMNDQEDQVSPGGAGVKNEETDWRRKDHGGCSWANRKKCIEECNSDYGLVPTKKGKQHRVRWEEQEGEEFERPSFSRSNTSPAEAVEEEDSSSQCEEKQVG